MGRIFEDGHHGPEGKIDKAFLRRKRAERHQGAKNTSIKIYNKAC